MVLRADAEVTLQVESPGCPTLRYVSFLLFSCLLVPPELLLSFQLSFVVNHSHLPSYRLSQSFVPSEPRLPLSYRLPHKSSQSLLRPLETVRSRHMSLTSFSYDPLVFEAGKHTSRPCLVLLSLMLLASVHVTARFFLTSPSFEFLCLCLRCLLRLVSSMPQCMLLLRQLSCSWLMGNSVRPG